MKKYAVIVAGGSGTRLGSAVPKQFLTVNGYPLLWWSLKAFHEEDPSTELILVLPEAFFKLWKETENNLQDKDRFPHKLAAGGTSRTESVKNGLKKINFNPRITEGLVAVHDAARPLVTPEMIKKGWDSALQSGAAIPVFQPVDSLRELTETGSKSVDRNRYRCVQTPQVFKLDTLWDAYFNHPESNFTDDAQAVEKAGGKISLFEGSADNMKVTNPGDIEIASILLKRKE